MTPSAADRTLRLAGELDLQHRAEVRALLDAVDDGEPLVIDLADAGFVDVQTIAMLVTRGGRTELRGASQPGRAGAPPPPRV